MTVTEPKICNREPPVEFTKTSPPTVSLTSESRTKRAADTEGESPGKNSESFASAFGAQGEKAGAAENKKIRISIAPIAAEKAFAAKNSALPPHRAKMHKSLFETIKAVKVAEDVAVDTAVLVDIATTLEDALQRLPKEKILKQFRSIEFNLKDTKNSKLRCGVLRQEIAPQALATMDSTDLANPEIQESRKHALEEKIERADTKNHKTAVKTGFFVCRRCGKRETTFYEMQTARGDEGSTKFVSCMNCGLNWKFR